jgi:hypothetical protein
MVWALQSVISTHRSRTSPAVPKHPLLPSASPSPSSSSAEISAEVLSALFLLFKRQVINFHARYIPPAAANM